MEIITSHYRDSYEPTRMTHGSCQPRVLKVFSMWVFWRHDHGQAPQANRDVGWSDGGGGEVYGSRVSGEAKELSLFQFYSFR